MPVLESRQFWNQNASFGIAEPVLESQSVQFWNQKPSFGIGPKPVLESDAQFWNPAVVLESVCFGPGGFGVESIKGCLECSPGGFEAESNRVWSWVQDGLEWDLLQ